LQESSRTRKIIGNGLRPMAEQETPPVSERSPEEARPLETAPEDNRPTEKPEKAPGREESAAGTEASRGDGSPPSKPSSSGSKEKEKESKEAESGKGKKIPLKPGVFYLPGSTAVRLLRPHRWRSGMYEVFQFKDEDLPQELREKVLRQGGWRDEERQWYELVESSHAERYELSRRRPHSVPECSWDEWKRLGSRYTPARPCSGCGDPFRHPDETKTLCAECTNARWHELELKVERLREEVEKAPRLPKGSWQQLKDLRAEIDKSEREKLFSRVRVARLRQKLHPVYRILIDRRRAEQESYRKLVEELDSDVKAVVERSFGSENPERAVVEELKRIRMRLRELTDRKKLGIKEFRRFISELRKASENEERKFTAYRKEQEEKQRRWEEGERAVAEELDAIEIGIEHNPENWRRLLGIRETINEKFSAGELGNQGRRRLLDIVNRLLDQEANLREMEREEVAVKRKVKKETSRKRANALKKSIRNVTIGLGFSQSRWDELVGIQREVIRMKNEGAITLSDFKEVMTQVNEKLDILKKLRGWSKDIPGGG